MLETAPLILTVNEAKTDRKGPPRPGRHEQTIEQQLL